MQSQDKVMFQAPQKYATLPSWYAKYPAEEAMPQQEEAVPQQEEAVPQQAEAVPQQAEDAAHDPVLTKLVTDATEAVLPQVIEELHGMLPDDKAIKYKFHAQCRNRLRMAMRDVLFRHGLCTPISQQREDLYIPYREQMRAYDPDMENKIRAGYDYVALARSDQFCKTLPMKLVEPILAKQSDALLVPHTRLLPYNVGALNAAHWNVPVERLSGDWRQVCRMGDLWHCVSPPGNGPHARFSLPCALLALRACASMPRVIDLDDTFHFHHPDNNSAAASQCLSRSGPAFIVAKHLAELWNDMVWEVYGQPAKDTPDATNAKAACYDTQEVCAMLCAMTLMLHANPEAAIDAAACFHPHREFDEDSSSKHILHRDPVPGDRICVQLKLAPAKKTSTHTEADMVLKELGGCVCWGSRRDRYVKQQCPKCIQQKWSKSKCPWKKI
jgi:hypothetical protein